MVCFINWGNVWLIFRECNLMTPMFNKIPGPYWRVVHMRLTMLDMFEGEGAKRAPGDLSLGWLSGMLASMIWRHSQPARTNITWYISTGNVLQLEKLCIIPMSISTIIYHGHNNYSNSNIVTIIAIISTIICTYIYTYDSCIHDIK